MDQSTTNPPLKLCAKRDKCINPLGCLLPATSENFGIDKHRSDGLSKWCKACYREANRLSRIKHADKRKATQREWREKNKDKINEYGRRYYAEHAKEKAKKVSSYNKSHPEIQKIHSVRRISRLCSIPVTFTASDWIRAIDYFNGCCAICGRQLNDMFGTHKASLDHWIPISKGGTSIPTNIVPLCHGVGGCNNRKSNRDPVEFLESTFGKHRARSILKRINAYFEWVKQ